MRLRNLTVYDTAEMKSVLRFAARGIRDAGVEVHVQHSDPNDSKYKQLHGAAYDAIPSNVSVAHTSKYLILIWLPGQTAWPSTTWINTVTCNREWPDGLALDCWEDALCWIGAHEFRHIWQFRKAVKSKAKHPDRPVRLGEADAEVYSFQRLDQFRAHSARGSYRSYSHE